MYIGNVGIFVKDLKGARRFFESYFGAKLLKSYNEPENNYYSDILELDHGAWLELMTKPEIVDEPKELNRSGLAHVCFKADTRQQLDDIVARFKKDGYKASRKGVGAVEFVIEYIYNGVIKSTLGDKAPKFAPYLLTIFFFILVMNLLGLIVIFPGGANLTGNISVTFVLALCTFIVVNVTGTKEYWKEIFWPDVPTWLKFPLPIMPLIEVFGVFTKPAALMIRLFANMMGGHMIVLALTSLIFIFGALGAAVMGATTVVSVVFSLFMLLLDTLVSFIQAYVFTMLSTLFISLSQVKGHH